MMMMMTQWKILTSNIGNQKSPRKRAFHRESIREFDYLMALYSLYIFGATKYTPAITL